MHVAYRSLATTPLLTVLAGCIAYPAPSSAAPPLSNLQLSSAQPDAPVGAEILALHNHERQRVGVPAMGWDPALEAAAIAYARALAASGRFAHSPREARIGQGENLWRGTAGAYSTAEMVGSWTGERRLFRAGIFPAVSANGKWADVGHYSQMIWRGSTRLGCGLASARGEDVLVCRYAPAGNVVGRAVP